MVYRWVYIKWSNSISILGSHNFMVTALGSCVKWALVIFGGLLILLKYPCYTIFILWEHHLDTHINSCAAVSSSKDGFGEVSSIQNVMSILGHTIIDMSNVLAQISFHVWDIIIYGRAKEVGMFGNHMLYTTYMRINCVLSNHLATTLATMIVDVALIKVMGNPSMHV